MSDERSISMAVTRSGGLNLSRYADPCMGELIAFHEIIEELSKSSDDGNVVRNWVENTWKHMTYATNREVHDALTQIIDVLKKSRDHMQIMSEDLVIPSEEYTVMIPQREVHDALKNFLLEVTSRQANRSEITSRAFLIAAESAFEVLFGNLTRVICYRHPGIIAKSDYSFSFEQLIEFESLDDAKDTLIAIKVESLLRESVDV